MYGNRFVNEQQAVNEAYFGKTEALLELEQAIGELRSVYTNKRDFTGSPELLKINRLVEKQFGMELFSMNIIPQNIKNAFTYVIGTKIDIALEKKVSKNVIANSKDGYRFKDGNGFCIVMCIFGGVLEDKNITDSEIVAVMLHEIGHNFADAINNKIEFANKEYAKSCKAIIIIRAIFSLGISLIADLKDAYNKYAMKREKRKQSKERKGKLHNFIYNAKGEIEDFKMNVDEFLARLQYRDIDYYKSLYTDSDKKKIQNSLGRQNEIIADKFAGIYGYGPEQIQALNKLTYFDRSKAYEWIEKFPWGHEVNLGYEEAYKDIYDYDVHPHNIQRANAEISVLKYELKKKNLDPKAAKIIRQQIKQLEDIKEEMKKLTKNTDDVLAIDILYSAVVDEKCPNAIKKEIEDNINKSIDDLVIKGDKQSK